MSFDSINNTYAGLSQAVKNEYLQAAHVLPFTGLEIKSVFSETEIAEVNKFLAEMKAATADNQKQSEAIRNYSAIAGKLLKLAKVVV